MKVLKFTLLFIIAIFTLSYCKKKEDPAPASPPPVNPLFTAGSGATDIDGNIYTSIVIDTQEWMVENLKVTKFSNGDSIPNITDGTQWSTLDSGAWCHYNNTTTYDNPYGKLYNWYTVADARGLCPAGWHMPSDAEWTALVNYLGGDSVAGGKMKEAGLTHWLTPNEGATNESGFTGLAGGYRAGNGVFYLMDRTCYWWTSTSGGTNIAMSRYLNYNTRNIYGVNYDKKYAYSVRCIKD